ncbi:MAG TPA: ATP synthase subunit I [Candidatus Angelobacter sp.]
MNAFLISVILLTGVGLSVIFYGGLWLTVRSLAKTRHPVLLTLASFAARTLVVIAAFLILTKGGWQSPLIALAGFLMGRFAVSAFLPAGETRHKCT